MTKARLFASALAVSLGFAVEMPVVSQSSAAGQLPAFDAASVKRNTSSDIDARMTTQGRTFSAINMQLHPVIAMAYEIAGPQSFRLVGGPDWVRADRFDIVATLPEGATGREVPAMLRNLLAARFYLAAHTETRETPMYALVVARRDGRLGPALRRATIDCEAEESAGRSIPPPKPGERGMCDSEIGNIILGRGQRLTRLARMLAQPTGRPVIDRTGLNGAFDYDLPNVDASALQRGDASGGIFTALQEQLGLKLEPIHGPLEYVVIDRIAQPTAN